MKPELPNYQNQSIKKHENYIPISLMNLDAKILKNVSKLNTTMHKNN